MSYRELIPHIVSYWEKFKDLDTLDFQIIETMCKIGVRNLSKVAIPTGIPQQVLSYRVKRFGKKELVRFRTIINEAKLGLKSYVAVANVLPQKLETGSEAMTCFPLWRYLALVDGWKRGNYVRYVVPPDREKDLKAFLDEVQKRRIILDYDIFSTTSPMYPFPNLNFYAKPKGIPIFNWDKWLKDIDLLEPEKLEEPSKYGDAVFDLYDLIILRCLEINARTKFRNIAHEIAEILGEEDHSRFVPLVTRRFHQHIIRQGLIRGYRAYVFPNPGPSVLFLIYYLKFESESCLKKFLSGLKYFPYITVYQKVLYDNALFIHLVIPVYEYSNMKQALTMLGEIGYLKDAHLLLADIVQASWDNVELYQMYKDGGWSFSYGIALDALEKKVLVKKMGKVDRSL